MNLEELTDYQKQKCFDEFKARCYLFYRIYQINNVLFEENSSLYGDLNSPILINNALVDHILLQFHLITDKAKFGKSDKNLSIFFFLEWNWEPEIKKELLHLALELKAFVEFDKYKNPRHKLFAHWDVKTILENKEPLGAFAVDEEKSFFII